MAQSLISIFKNTNPGILGYASLISPEKVIELTNQERSKTGASPLKLSPLLTQAATAKAADMIARSYWAHNTPDGQEPWVFISNAGYNYLHAGENLARDFSSPEAAVNAWMNSTSHRKNLLNSSYQEIGVAVVDGKINGIETTLIVQMFGTSLAGKPEVTTARTAAPIPVALAQETSSVAIQVTPLDVSRSISLAFILLLIAVLAFDWFVVWRRNLIRLSGKNWAHLTFLSSMAIILILLKQGLVL